MSREGSGNLEAAFESPDLPPRVPVASLAYGFADVDGRRIVRMLSAAMMLYAGLRMGGPLLAVIVSTVSDNFRIFPFGIDDSAVRRTVALSIESANFLAGIVLFVTAIACFRIRSWGRRKAQISLAVMLILDVAQYVTWAAFYTDSFLNNHPPLIRALYRAHSSLWFLRETGVTLLLILLLSQRTIRGGFRR